MVPASGSHTGRVTPRVTLNVTSFAVPESASMRSTPRSRSVWRLAMLSASPVQVVATQLTHWPPCTMPPLKVQSSDVMPSMTRICRAISRIAERPDDNVAPAWLGLATASRLKRAVAVRPGTAPVFRPAGPGHQYIFIGGSFGLDQVARRGRADFFVRCEQHGDRQRRRERRPRQLPDRFQCEVVAALHVEDP